MTTGARRGEMCAIRWSAVNLDEGRESIWLRARDPQRHRRRLGRGRAEDPPAPPPRPRQRDGRVAARAPRALRGPRRRARRCSWRRTRSCSPIEPDGSTFKTPDSRDPALRAAGRSARHQDDAPQAAPLLGHGADPGRGRHPYGRRSARPWWWRHDDASDVHRVGIGSRPARGRWLGNTDLNSAWRPREARSRRTDPQHPYEKVAADIADHAEEGAPAPTVDELAVRHGVSAATARRGIALARDWGK